MYRLMVIDDEERVRYGIKISMDFQKTGIEFAGEASDGLEALELLDSVKPDIIITDVLMPRMDGLEFMKRCLLKRPDTKIIILSGYDDFSYVQAAVRNGGFDYLLKPVTVEGLSEVISKAVNALDKIKHLQEEQELIKDQFYQSLPFLREKYLNSFINGDTTFEELTGKYGYIGIRIKDGYSMAVAVTFQQAAGLTEEADMMDPHAGMVLVKSAIQKELLGEFCGEVLLDTENRCIVILNCSSSVDCYDNIRKVISLLDRIGLHLKRENSICLYAGIGEIIPHAAGIPSSCKQALEALEFRLFYDVGKVVYIGDISTNQMEQISYPIDLEEKLLLALKIGDTGKTADHLIEFSRHFMNQGNIQPIKIRRHFIRLLYSIFRKIEEWSLDSCVKEKGVYENKITDAVSLKHIETVMNDLMGQVTHAIQEDARSKNLTVVAKALEFMNQNYGSDLSLQEIAGKVYLTPNYFAGIFKEKTGMTLMDCLTDIRMQKARELLANTHLKSHEIAVRVGYTDTKYFGQVFRKLTGHTPLEYREIVISNN